MKKVSPVIVSFVSSAESLKNMRQHITKIEIDKHMRNFFVFLIISYLFMSSFVIIFIPRIFSYSVCFFLCIIVHKYEKICATMKIINKEEIIIYINSSTFIINISQLSICVIDSSCSLSLSISLPEYSGS